MRNLSFWARLGSLVVAAGCGDPASKGPTVPWQGDGDPATGDGANADGASDGSQGADGQPAGGGDGAAPGDGSGGDGTPGDGTPSDGSAGDGTPSDGTPSDGTPSDGTPSDGTPSDGSAGDGAPGDGSAGDGTPDGSSGDGSSGDGPVRFIVMGDGGTGDDNQKKVAAAVRDVCAQRGCDFALYMGDNIYEKGADRPSDAIFQTHFEDPYAELDFPFYVALGNHDYGGTALGGLVPGGSNADGTIIEAKAQAQIDYGMTSAKWVMPAAYYTFRKGPVAFFALDTNSLVLKRPLLRQLDEQQAWLDAQMAASDAPWKIVFGHHPYVSNGEHGNTGDYKSIVPILGEIADADSNGTGLKTLVEESVCNGNAQLYMSGHDHDREWLDACGTSFIVSGAAAKLDPIEGRGSDSRWSNGTKRGFLWAEIDGDTFVGVFYDEDGAISYQDSVTR